MNPKSPHPILDPEARRLIRLLRPYSKATLMEYLAHTAGTWPRALSFHLIRLIEQRNLAQALMKLANQAAHLRRYLLKRRAVEETNGKLRFCAFRSRPMLAHWLSLVRLSKRIECIRSQLKALEILTAPSAASSPRAPRSDSPEARP